MPLPKNLDQLERTKFREAPGGSVSVGIINVGEYEVNDVQKTGNTTYYGQENADGVWLARKIVRTVVGVTSSTNISYASIKNNPLITTYDAAWAARTTLTYGKYSQSI
jgi:hypothetical protein